MHLHGISSEQDFRLKAGWQKGNKQTGWQNLCGKSKEKRGKCAIIYLYLGYIVGKPMCKEKSLMP